MCCVFQSYYATKYGQISNPVNTVGEQSAGRVMTRKMRDSTLSLSRRLRNSIYEFGSTLVILQSAARPIALNIGFSRIERANFSFLSFFVIVQ